jgi:hypothetical protein
MVRLIRRSVRCLVFGAIGFVPILGLGLAEQALRLRRLTLGEMGLEWRVPAIYWLWGFATVAIWCADRFFGIVADAIVLFGFLLLQVWFLWREFPADLGPIWNPGCNHVFWGVALAYGGILNSLAVLAALAQRLTRFWES